MTNNQLQLLIRVQTGNMPADGTLPKGFIPSDMHYLQDADLCSADATTPTGDLLLDMCKKLVPYATAKYEAQVADQHAARCEEDMVFARKQWEAISYD